MKPSVTFPAQTRITVFTPQFCDSIIAIFARKGHVAANVVGEHTNCMELFIALYKKAKVIFD